MRIILCVLLAAGVALAQVERGNKAVSGRPAVGSPAPVPQTTLGANAPADAAAVVASSGRTGAAGPAASGPAPAGAGAGAGAGARAGAGAGPATTAGGGFGPAFFGPGLNNPLALPPNPQLIQSAQAVAASIPDVRVRVGVDGQIEFTNIYGEEIEIVDQFGFDPLEPVDPREFQEAALKHQQRAQERLLQQNQFAQERLQQNRLQEFNRRRFQLEQQLLNEFGLGAGGNLGGNIQGGFGGGNPTLDVAAPVANQGAAGGAPGVQRTFRIAI